MLRNTDLARFVTALLANAIKGGYSHRCLFAFNAATLHDLIIRSKTLDEGTLAFLLPALLEPLSNRTDASLKEAIVRGPDVLTNLTDPMKARQLHPVSNTMPQVSSHADCAANHRHLHSKLRQTRGYDTVSQRSHFSMRTPGRTRRFTGKSSQNDPEASVSIRCLQILG